MMKRLSFHLSSRALSGLALFALAPQLFALGDLTRTERWRECLELDDPAAVLSQKDEAFAQEGFAANGEALALYARALRTVGQEENARQFLEAAKPSKETRAFVTLELARLDLAQDKLREAIARLSVEGKPGTPRENLLAIDQTLFLLAQAHARAGKLDFSAALLHTYLGRSPLEPESASAWHMLAREAGQRGDRARAAKFRQRAQETSSWFGYYNARRLQIRENPKAPLPRIGLAVLMLQAQRPERAREALLELLEVAPDHGPAYPWLSEAERKLGNFQAAYDANEKALAHDPENLDHQINRGLLLHQLKGPLEAIDVLEPILLGAAAENERYLAAHLTLARLYLEVGREAQAFEQHERYRLLGGNEPLR